MARKNSNARKPADVSTDTEPVVVSESHDNVVSASTESASDESPPAKSKVKAKEEPPASTSVGLADIRKAVAFSNSVGGLDNAIALLQILKVAKEVQ